MGEEETEEPKIKKRNSKFNDLVRNRLEERFNLLLQFGKSEIDYASDSITFGNQKTIPLTDNREIWYHTVDEFKVKYPGEVIDLSEQNRYKIVTQAINKFCDSKIAKFGEELVKIDPRLCVHYGVLRKAMGVLAKERAKSFGYTLDKLNEKLEKTKRVNEIAVTDKNRAIFKDSGLMLVICEKERMAVKWLLEMKNRGWKGIDMIDSGGFTVAEVMEMVYDIKERIEIEETSFHVGVIHDLDGPGVLIYHTIKRFFPKVLDLGINFDMLDSELQGYWEQYKEPQKLTADQRTALKNAGYGKLIPRLGNFRLEINNLDARKGMKPLADWAEKLIEEYCTEWDLNRVGKPEYYDPTDFRIMEQILNELWHKIVKKITGEEWYSLDLKGVATDRFEEICKANRRYKANAKEIQEYEKIIESQSEELQEIVDNDENNQEIVAKLKALVQKLNIPVILKELADQGEDADLAEFDALLEDTNIEVKEEKGAEIKQIIESEKESSILELIIKQLKELRVNLRQGKDLGYSDLSGPEKIVLESARKQNFIHGIEEKLTGILTKVKEMGEAWEGKQRDFNIAVKDLQWEIELQKRPKKGWVEGVISKGEPLRWFAQFSNWEAIFLLRLEEGSDFEDGKYVLEDILDEQPWQVSHLYRISYQGYVVRGYEYEQTIPENLLGKVSSVIESAKKKQQEKFARTTKEWREKNPNTSEKGK